MCIIFVAINEHPRYPLIIAANRDEYHARATTAMHPWAEHCGIIAGRDELAAGSWFGVNQTGGIAAVTNYRTAEVPTTRRSRGELVTRFLRECGSGADIADYGDFLRREHDTFNPFNLLYGRKNQLYYFSSVGAIAGTVANGIHSISNGALDASWAKRTRGVSLLREQILAHRDSRLTTNISETAKAQFAEDLARMMRDSAVDEVHLPLPTDIAAHEKRRFSIFIHGEEYGTRTTTLLLGDDNGFALYEYNYCPAGKQSGRQHYTVEFATA